MNNSLCICPHPRILLAHSLRGLCGLCSMSSCSSGSKKSAQAKNGIRIYIQNKYSAKLVNKLVVFHNNYLLNCFGVVFLPGCKLACVKHEFCSAGKRYTKDGIPIATAAGCVGGNHRQCTTASTAAQSRWPSGAGRCDAGHFNTRPGPGRVPQVDAVPTTLAAACLHERYHKINF